MDDKARIVAAGRWLNHLAATDRPLLAAVLGLPLAAGALLVMQAMLLAGLLHRAIVDAAALPALLPQVALLATILVIRIALSGLGETAAVQFGEAIKGRVRAALVADLLRRPPTWTAARSSGALSSTVLEQVEALDGYFTRYLPAMVQAAILPIAFAVIAFSVDWIVALLFLISAPLIPVFMALAGWGAEAASRSQAAALNRLSGRFADRLRGLVTLKLFGEDAAETARVRQASEELRVRTMRVMRIAFLSSAVLEFFAALGVAGVALYVGLTFLGLVSVHSTELTLAAGMFLLLMAPEVYQPLRLLAAHYHDRSAAIAAVAEIERELDGLPEAMPPVAAIATPAGAEAPATLELRAVAVNDPTGRQVMTAAELMLDPGARIAILGPSGIGKSTLLEAIAGLRDFDGDIRIDGRALGDIAEPELRHRVAMLGQRPRLFAGSIADNIRLGRRDADHAAIRRAAQLARVADFADALPEGFATQLGEDGLGLSGGEIQRIALARLYLRDPGLLLLDEPTAHLDAATEALVLDGLTEFAVGRTLVVATHSRAVAARMDKVFRIAGGKLLPAPKPAVADRSVGAA
ncbi:MAG TPA: thiol reductant ABC exporter subunit CydD [Devosia sp.]|jgi:ATP-binding cassette subfamily C protein CydD|uniref:thiol reductant ABC exporter subunit CydD n=1 Tax=Devosia sp. TaxID=1871048 RepID=UPI002DDD836D|nr:thiol reductant ABC exporter subunit CydD [Devosia sp.]HEV2516021.1 thiol reductant ABC exporter subunit CydD [Devosia sp.]